MRISSFLKHGMGVWWKNEEGGMKFLDVDNDPDFQPQGPQLHHYRNITLPDVYHQISQDWNTILHTDTTLPIPSIRLYDTDGNYKRSVSFFATDIGVTPLNSMQTSPEDVCLPSSPVSIQTSSEAVEISMETFTDGHIFTPVKMCVPSLPHSAHQPLPRQLRSAWKYPQKDLKLQCAPPLRHKRIVFPVV